MSIRTRITARIRQAIDGAREQARAAAWTALGLDADVVAEVRRTKGRSGPVRLPADDASGMNASGTVFSARGVEPRVPVLDEWDVVDVREALLHHEYGVFQRSALLADYMGRQDRIRGVLGTRVNAVLSMPRRVAPADASAEAAIAAELLSKRYDRMVTRGTRASLVRWLVMMGVVICQRVWQRDPKTGLWDVVLEPWHPTWVRWDHAAGLYRVNTTAGVEECYPDGSNPRWCVVSLLDTHRPWMEGAIRALAIPFLIITWAYRDWARWSEKHGLPPLGAKVPSNERFRKETEQFLADLEQLASEPTILLPEGFELEWKELKGWQSFQGFRDLATKQETNVAIALLGQNLTTEVTGGSYAAARSHELVRRDYLTGTAQAVDEGERHAVAVPWCRVNVEADPVAAELLAPRPTTDTEPPVDRKERAQTLLALGQAIGALQKAGVRVDASKLAAEHDVPQLAAPTAPTTTPPPATPAGTPAPPRPTEPTTP